jgi:hypothetical protein
MGRSGVILVQESITPPTGCAEVRVYIRTNKVLVRLLSSVCVKLKRPAGYWKTGRAGVEVKVT